MESFPHDKVWLSDRREFGGAGALDSAILFATATAYIASAAIMLRLITWMIGAL